jgi:hypothetical protein
MYGRKEEIRIDVEGFMLKKRGTQNFGEARSRDIYFFEPIRRRASAGDWPVKSRFAGTIDST